MQFKLRLIPAATAACLLAACGGGGSSPSSPTYSPTSGTVVDGYLQFSKVVCDINGNGMADTGEAVAFTTISGTFSFPQGCTYGTIASGGQSADTGLMFVGQLRSPAGATIISPLTTLMAAGLTQAQISATLGLTTDLLNTDPAAMSGGALVNADLLKKTLAMQQLLQKTTEMFAGAANAVGSSAIEAIYNAVSTAFASILKDGLPLFSGGVSNVDVINAMVQAAAVQVQSSSAVMPEVKAAITAKGGPAPIADLVSAALQVQADQYLAAATDPASLTALTLDRQTNEAITNAIQAADDLSLLSTVEIDALATQTATTAAAPTPAPTDNPAFVTFDEATVAFTNMGAYGGALPSVEAGPAGGSGNALKILKPVSPEPWGGTFFTTAAVPFAADKKKISARVYSTRANAVIKFKVEIAGGAFIEVASAPTGAANTWSTVTWDFSAVDLTKSYTTIAITPDADVVTSGQSYYIDDITVIASDGTTAPTLTWGTSLSFDEATVAFADMGAYGGALPSVEAGPAGGSGNALKILKPVSPEPWGGTFFTTAAVPFAADKKKISARVYSTRANAVIKFKVEIAGGAFIEVASVPTGAANTWSTVTWDFSAVDLTKSYTTIAITPDADVVTSGQSYYIDDITVIASSVAPTNYLYLAGNALSYTDGTTTTSYSMTQFQSATGISVKWPMAPTAALKLNLAENGSFVMAQGQTLSAAVSITQDTPSGAGEVKAYIDNVSVTKNGDSITVTVPTTAAAKVYGVSYDAKTKAVIDFSSAVRGVTNVLSSAVNSVSTVVLGDVVNFAVNGVSNDFTGMNALRGKYKVSIVVTQLPLRQADGSLFPTLTIQVPTELDSSGNPVAAKTVPVQGPGLEGFITLTD